MSAIELSFPAMLIGVRDDDFFLVVGVLGIKLVWIMGLMSR